MFFSKREHGWFLQWAVAATALARGADAFTSSVSIHPAPVAAVSQQSNPRQYLLSPSSLNRPLHHRHRVLGGKTVLFRIRCENKYYQLEEMEDRENSTTELFLKEDGTILLGDTDGPLWTSAVGEWMIAPGSNDFVMTITKRFGAGQDNSDMGEFEYELERTFQGEMIEVGESVAITGVMLCEDPLTGKEQEVGFFNMIDGTDVREDKRPDAQSGTRDETEFEAMMRKQNTPAGVTGHDGIPSAFRQQQSPTAPSGGFGAPMPDPYGYGAPPQGQQPNPYSQPQPVLSYEEQLRKQQQGFNNNGGYGQSAPMGQPMQPQADPYSSYYNQNQPPPPPPPPTQNEPYGTGGYGQTYAPQPGMGSGYGRPPPPPPQQQQNPYGYGSNTNKPSLDPYGGGNFERQSPHPSEAFGGYGHRTYGIYGDDDPGYGGPPPSQQQQQEQANDPYGYQGNSYGDYQEDPNPVFPPQQPLNPYGQDGYSQDGWPRYP
ncbi:hypothetical protein IV203_038751 [Nitzschia inconspicua]|uniref:Uncharacterized protein n=1 Tax=Nitzschia inconspicua TaxID=303405 RepID=A0A9K3PZ85_9STRA|nr:hypothetical protein IV203_038751 [Nitzschia inconspicua]